MDDKQKQAFKELKQFASSSGGCQYMKKSFKFYNALSKDKVETNKTSWYLFGRGCYNCKHKETSKCEECRHYNLWEKEV